jgi:hypothetical protein
LTQEELIDVVTKAYLEGWQDAKSSDRGETAADEWLLSETYSAVHAPVEIISEVKILYPNNGW